MAAVVAKNVSAITAFLPFLFALNGNTVANRAQPAKYALPIAP